MSYQALARTWRPRSFDDLVGQEHVVKALVHALDDDRLHHAYLFTGTRGVGKTTIARILAKCLNCEQGVSSKPCGECSACQEIDEGRFIDLLEVDAASRTKVDDTRELLDNVQYAPSRGRYKVYLVDEVHMLSGHSFNAFLKTLEEPPPHVKFLLATTDPQKLPVTVLSRCLQFNLKRLPVNLIEPRLVQVTQAEKIGAEPAALALLARAADGSMRDALSLLDQAAAYCQNEIKDAEVRSMLGTIDQRHAVRLLDALAAGDAQALLGEVATLDERVPDYIAALDELAALIQRVAIGQVAGVADDDERGDVETIRRLAEAVGAEDLQLYYQIALIGKRDLHLAPSRRAGFEMVLLRMATFTPASGAAPGPKTGRQQDTPGAASSGGAKTGAARARASAQAALDAPSRSKSAVTKASPGLPSAVKAAGSAPAVKRAAPASKPAPASEAAPESEAAPASEAAPESEAAPVTGAAPVSESAPASKTALVSESAPASKTASASETALVSETAPASETAPISDSAPVAESDPASGPAAGGALPREQSQWNAAVDQLGLRGGAKQLAASCHLDHCDGDALHLTLDSARRHLYTDTLRQKLRKALSAHYGRDIQVRIEAGKTGSETLAQRRDREVSERQREAVEQIARDPNVMALKETFGARVDESSIRPK